MGNTKKKPQHRETGNTSETEAAPEEQKFIWNLRPKTLEEYIGQPEIVDSVKIAIDAALKRGDVVDHMLFHGPPGLGKTTLAHIIATEMRTKITRTSGPALEKPVDIVGILSNLENGEVFFIDEIHRIPRTLEEYLYSAMEDYQVDFIYGKGAYAKSLPFQLKRFTLVGATTRAGLLTPALRDRFGMIYHMDYYSVEDLTKIVLRSASLLGVRINKEASEEIARRARGTPRVANRLLKRVRDYAEVKADGNVILEIVKEALMREGVDIIGLDKLDRLYLNTIITNYNGGPVGIEALAATINEEVNTLADVVEPFLLKIGLITRTSSGRKATERARRYLGTGDIEEQQKRMF